MSEAPEKIVASVDWRNINGHRMRFGCVTVGTDGVPSPFFPTHYIRKDVSDALVAAAREEALREAAAIAQQKHDAAMEWAAESHFKELVGTDTDSSRIADEILALITKDAENG